MIAEHYYINSCAEQAKTVSDEIKNVQLLFKVYLKQRQRDINKQLFAEGEIILRGYSRNVWLLIDAISRYSDQTNSISFFFFKFI